MCRSVAGARGPATIVGDGPVERALCDAGAGDRTLTADQWIGADGLPEGPIFVPGPIEGVEGIMESTPSARRQDLVFFQNGMLDPALDRYGLGLTDANPNAATQCLALLGAGEEGGYGPWKGRGVSRAIGGRVPVVRGMPLQASGGKWCGAEWGLRTKGRRPHALPGTPPSGRLEPSHISRSSSHAQPLSNHLVTASNRLCRCA